MDVSIWINKMLESFQSWDITTVIKLLKDAKISGKGDICMVVSRAVKEVIEDSGDQEAFTEFATNYAMYMLHKQEQSSIIKAFSHLSTSIKGYSRFYQSQVVTGGWSVPLIDFLCRTLKDLSYLAEKAYKASKEESKELSDPPLKMAKVTLETVFNKSQIIKESFPDSRKLAAFYTIIHICEMFFRAGKYRMWLRYTHWVEKQQDGFELLPEHVKVSYYYYEGLLDLFQYHYIKAYKSLNYSIDHCKTEVGEFQSRVMRYLVPLNILFGEYPTDKELEDHKLQEYKEIATACETGNLALFEHSLEIHEEKFLQTSIYLVLEKLKNVVLRNFFQKVYNGNQGNHILQLQAVTDAYNKSIEESKIPVGGSGEENKGEDDDEKVSVTGLEWILAGLIYKGFIKGYISHDKGLLVLSKKDAFPELRSVIEKNGSNI